MRLVFVFGAESKWVQGKLYLIFLWFVFQARVVLCGCEEGLSMRIALTKSWLKLRFKQRFEEEQSLITVEHHGGHHRRLHRGQRLLVHWRLVVDRAPDLVSVEEVVECIQTRLT